MKPAQIFNEPYLRSRAIQAIEDSLRVLEGQEKKDFASEALSFAEANGAPVDLLDELYLASQD